MQEHAVERRAHDREVQVGSAERGGRGHIVQISLFDGAVRGAHACNSEYPGRDEQDAEQRKRGQ